MTPPPPRVNAPHAARTSPRNNLPAPLLLFVIFAGILLPHVPLLTLPYYWDEAGYFVPAARDLLHRLDPVPLNTLSNAHPPLVMVYLAVCWKLFGEGIVVTRVAMLLVASLTLLAVFYLARRVANLAVAVASTLLTALYPVFFAQSALAHLDMAAAALTIWGLFFYVPPRGVAGADDSIFLPPPPWGRLAVSTVFFALAALAKETAILTPLALFGWTLLAPARRAWESRPAAFSFGGHRAEIIKAFSLLLSLLPLALWLAYHYSRTGYVFGNPEFFRYNVEATLTPARILFAGAERLWHVTGHMNLFLLTGAAALAMLLRRPLHDAGDERPRIDLGTQLVFAVLILAHVAALSFVGGAVLARYMLPVTPLLIIICVSTLWRRARNWRQVTAVVCAGFVLALFVNPPRRYPWEENLAYRDFILLHRGAAQFIADTRPDARVLTAWPATDELRDPYFGYTPLPLSAVTIEHFSAEQLAAARDASQFDLALIFSTNYSRDLPAEDAATLLGGRIVFRAERQGQWVAIITK